MMALIENIIQWDKQVILSWNAAHTPFLDNVAWLLSETAMWAPVALILLYVLVKNKKAESLFILLALALLIVFVDQVAASLVKPLVARPRPTRTMELIPSLELVRHYRGGAYGFPSNHAANMFAFATFSVLLFKHRGYSSIIFVWAMLGSLSRIYLSVHYPTDVACGALFGCLSGWLFYGLYRRVAKQYGAGSASLMTDRKLYTPSFYARKDIKLLTLSLVLVLSTIGLASFYLR